jgi:hypothetical protein
MQCVHHISEIVGALERYGGWSHCIGGYDMIDIIKNKQVKSNQVKSNVGKTCFDGTTANIICDPDKYFVIFFFFFLYIQYINIM